MTGAQRHWGDRTGPLPAGQPRVVVPGIRIESECTVIRERPIPGRWPVVAEAAGTIGSVEAPAGQVDAPSGLPPRVRIPRWIQLVGLPLVAFLAFGIAQTVGHTVVLFVVAGLIALFLDPLVRAVEKVGLRRGLAVALVYLAFLAALVVIIGALATVVVGQTKTAASRFNSYFTVANGRTHKTDASRDVDRLQRWLDANHLRGIQIAKPGHKFVDSIRKRDVGKYTSRAVSFVEGAAISIGKALFSTVLVIVVSVYMLLDLRRFGKALDRRFPPHTGPPLLCRAEDALVSYLRGQILLSLIMGVSAGLGLYLLGITGLLPGADTYALLFGGWVAVTELLPYVGPWIGEIPPLIFAAVVHPVAVIWVAILFLIIHQVEGHVVVPNVMGNALRLHPLLVIFGLLAGIDIDGLAGVLMALPLLAVARATWEFFGERVEFERWRNGTIPVEVEIEHVAGD